MLTLLIFDQTLIFAFFFLQVNSTFCYEHFSVITYLFIFTILQTEKNIVNITPLHQNTIPIDKIK